MASTHRESSTFGTPNATVKKTTKTVLVSPRDDEDEDDSNMARTTPTKSNKEKVEKNIKEPRDQDVLCGRGGSINSHAGNERFRQLVEMRKRVYLTARFKREKRLIASSIVEEIRSAGGRFLTRDAKTTLWADIGDAKARDKTSQALRENAPTIRAEMEVEINQQRKEQREEDERAAAERAAAAAASAPYHHHHYGTHPPPPSHYGAGPPPPGYWGYHNSGFYAHGYHAHPPTTPSSHHPYQVPPPPPPPSAGAEYGYHHPHPSHDYGYSPPHHATSRPSSTTPPPPMPRRSWSYDDAVEQRQASPHPSPRASPTTTSRRGRAHGHYPIHRTPSHDNSTTSSSGGSRAGSTHTPPHVTPPQTHHRTASPYDASHHQHHHHPPARPASTPLGAASSLTTWTKTSWSFGGHSTNSSSDGRGSHSSAPNTQPAAPSSAPSTPKPLAYVHHPSGSNGAHHSGSHHRRRPPYHGYGHSGTAFTEQQRQYDSSSSENTSAGYNPSAAIRRSSSSHSVTPETASNNNRKRDSEVLEEQQNVGDQSLLTQVANHIMGSWDTSTMIACSVPNADAACSVPNADAACSVPVDPDAPCQAGGEVFQVLPSRQSSMSSSNADIPFADAAVNLPPVKEEEEGQEVELVEMMEYDDIGEPLMDMDDDEDDEDDNEADEKRMPPPKPKSIEIDWSAKIGCQSQWLPDTFSNTSFFSPRAEAETATHASTTTVQQNNMLDGMEMNSTTGDNFSHAGSVGGGSLTNVFTNDSGDTEATTTRREGAEEGDLVKMNGMVPPGVQHTSTMTTLNTSSVGGAVYDHLAQVPSWERSMRSRSPSTIGSLDEDDDLDVNAYHHDDPTMMVSVPKPPPGISPKASFASNSGSRSPPTSPRQSLVMRHRSPPTSQRVLPEAVTSVGSDERMTWETHE